MADCFENVPLENIETCPNEELQAGLSPKMQFSPENFIQTMTLPELTAGSTLESVVTITADIVPIAGQGFVEIDLQTDLNSFEAALVGNKGNKKDQTTLNCFIPGTKPKVLGFKKLYKNVRGIFIVKDNNSQTWIIGTKDKPAYFDNFAVNTGTGNEDNNGGTVTVVANTDPYLYTGVIPLKTEPVEP